MQDIASKARAGTIPHDFINGEVAIKSRDIALREVSRNEAEEATARMVRGVGFVLTAGWVMLISIVTLIVFGSTAAAGVLIHKRASTNALNLEIAKIKAAKGDIPDYVEAGPMVAVDVGTGAGVGFATIGLVGLVGWWLAKRA